MKLSKKSFLLGILIGLVLLISFVATLPDGKLHIVFCDVGEGDAVYIRTPSNADLLIDGGPDNKVLSCLGKHMPFYDRTIDVVILSHPQKDHITGLISVLQRYRVKYAVASVVGNETEGYKAFIETISKKNIPLKNLYYKDTFSLDRVKFSVLWPEREWLAQNLSSPLGNLGSLSHPSVLGFSTASRDLNDFSYYIHLSYGSFDVLFTGDGDAKIQPEIIRLGNLPDSVEILKFPHHGSRTAVLPEFLDKIKPELVVISVGKNPYGHPNPEAIQLLIDRAIKLKRTDQAGDIEVLSDGKNWFLK